MFVFAFTGSNVRPETWENCDGKKLKENEYYYIAYMGLDRSEPDLPIPNLSQVKSIQIICHSGISRALAAFSYNPMELQTAYMR
jgi:hypothetical protein